MENTMRGNDMQNRCGLNDTQALRSPPEVDCQQPESPQGGPRHLGEACAPRTGTSARGSGQRRALAGATAPRRHASRLRSGFGSGLRTALLSVLALVFVLPLVAPAAAQEVVEVPRGWPLSPSGVSAGDSFRLLFVTSTSRGALSKNIGEYNTYVQGRAGAGHSSIRPFSSQFQALASTPTVHARNNTSTTYTTSDKGVPIWWLSGDKVADEYEDFYDGSWDNKSGKGKTESGAAYNNFFRVWTGSNNDGTATSNPLGGPSSGIQSVTYTQLSQSATLNSGTAGKVATMVSSPSPRCSGSPRRSARSTSRSSRPRRTPVRAISRAKSSGCGSVSPRP